MHIIKKRAETKPRRRPASLLAFALSATMAIACIPPMTVFAADPAGAAPDAIGGAALDPLATYDVIVNGGAADKNPASEFDEVTIFAAAAPAGHVFDKWVVDSGGAVLDDEYSGTTLFIMPASAVEITATYVKYTTETPADTPLPDDGMVEGLGGDIDMVTAFAANPFMAAMEVGGETLNPSFPYLLKDGTRAKTGTLGATAMAHYDRQTGVLTLHNYAGGKIKGKPSGGSLIPIEDFTVKLVGNNTITDESNSSNAIGIEGGPYGGNITITSDSAASLAINIKGRAEYRVFGIWCRDSDLPAETSEVTIRGNANVTMNLTNASKGAVYGIIARHISILENASYTFSGDSTASGSSGKEVNGLRSTNGGNIIVNTNGMVLLDCGSSTNGTGSSPIFIGTSAKRIGKAELQKAKMLSLKWPPSGNAGQALVHTPSAFAVNVNNTKRFATYRFGWPRTVELFSGEAHIPAGTVTGPHGENNGDGRTGQYLAGDTITVSAAQPATFANWTASPALPFGFTSVSPGTATFFMPQVDGVSQKITANYFTQPSAPRDLALTFGDGQVKLDWKAPSSNGGSPITGYEISHGAASGYTPNWTAIPASGAGTVTHTVTGLTNGTRYTFELRAVNIVNKGESTGRHPITIPIHGQVTDAAVRVTIPVGGAAPINGPITGGANYTASVQWHSGTEASLGAAINSPSTFVSGQAYVAQVVLTPVSGFTFTNPAFVKINGKDAATRYPNPSGAGANAVTYRMQFTATPQVNIKAIPGVTPPQSGQRPVTSIETAQYTGKVAWNPSPFIFDYSTDYTAYIEIEAKPGYTLSGLPYENYFTVAGAATVSGILSPGAYYYDVTAVFPATGADPNVTVTMGEIPGVTPPAAGAVPVTAIGEHLQYTGTVVWTPAVYGTFEYGTEYTATINLTPKAGFTFRGITAWNFFTVAGSAGSAFFSTSSGNVTAFFPMTAGDPTDLVPPVLSDGTVNRTSDTAATIGFNSDKIGRVAYYVQMNSGAAAPSKTSVKDAGSAIGVTISAGRNAFMSVTLSAGARDIYVVAENASGYLSEPLKIEVLAYGISKTNVSFTVEQTGGASGTADSTGITITFDKAVTGLNAGYITLYNGFAAPSGRVTKGALSGSGATYTIGLASVEAAGNINVLIGNFGAFNVTTSLPVVVVYKDTTAPPALTYNPGDVAAVNAMIDNNYLAFTKAVPADGSYIPADWEGVEWAVFGTVRHIRQLDLYSQGLSGTLNLTGLSHLKYVDVGNNNLTGITLTGTAIVELSAYENKLPALDVGGLLMLSMLNCSGNNLAALDLANNKDLEYVDVSLNEFADAGAITGTSDITGFTGWDGADGRYKYSPQKGGSRPPLTLDYGYLVLVVGETATLSANGMAAADVEWTSGDTAVATVAADGKVTAISKGTIRVTAKAKAYVSYAECRVDVVDTPLADAVTGVKLKQTSVTSNVCSLNYTKVGVLPVLQQNIAPSALSVSALAEETKPGVAIAKVELVNAKCASYFETVVLDAGTFELRPTALGKAAKAATLTTNVNIYIKGKPEPFAAGKLTINLTKKWPTLKLAKALKFNSFFPAAELPVAITSSIGKVTKVELTDGADYALVLADNAADCKTVRLASKNNKPKKLKFRVWVDSFEAPRVFTANVSTKATKPSAKLNMSTVTIIKGVDLKVTSAREISKIEVRDSKGNPISSYSISGLSGGSFKLAYDDGAGGQVKARTSLKLYVYFADNDSLSPSDQATLFVSLPLTIKPTASSGAVTVTLSKTTVTLNKQVAGDRIALNAVTTPIDGELPPAVYTKASDADIIDISKSGKRIVVSWKDSSKAAKGASYKIKFGNATLTVKASDIKPKVTLTAKGTLNVINPASAVVITPKFANYNYNGMDVALVDAAVSPFKIVNANTSGAVTLRMKDVGDGTNKTKAKTAVWLEYKDAEGNTVKGSIAITPKLVKPKISQSAKQVTLYKNDRYSEGRVNIVQTSPLAAKITDVSINGAAANKLYAIRKIQDGRYVIHFKDNIVGNVGKGQTLKLNIYMNGQATPATSINVKVVVG